MQLMEQNDMTLSGSVFCRAKLTKISCHFTCEKRMEMESYQIRSLHFTNENGTFLHLKYLIHMSNDKVQNVKCEILVYKTRISYINWKVAILKINF